MFELELDGTWLKSIGPLNASSSFLTKEVKAFVIFQVGMYYNVASRLYFLINMVAILK
jgi:hypothetical protein